MGNLMYTKDDVEKLLKLRDEGKTNAEIGKVLGRTRFSVINKLNRLDKVNGTPKDKMPRQTKVRYSKENIDTIIRMRKEGKTYRQIGAALGRGADSIKTKHRAVRKKIAAEHKRLREQNDKHKDDYVPQPDNALAEFYRVSSETCNERNTELQEMLLLARRKNEKLKDEVARLTMRVDNLITILIWQHNVSIVPVTPTQTDQDEITA